MINDSLPAASAVDLSPSAICHLNPGQAMTYPLADIAGSGGRVVRATKPVSQEKVDGLTAPFCWCQTGDSFC
jgi:hypothetical protein